MEAVGYFGKTSFLVESHSGLDLFDEPGLTMHGLLCFDAKERLKCQGFYLLLNYSKTGCDTHTCTFKSKLFNQDFN